MMCLTVCYFSIDHPNWIIASGLERFDLRTFLLQLIRKAVTVTVMLQT
jgi:hypothetical protein